MDLGSNTLRLLVAEVDASGWRAVERAMATPRLGLGLRPGAALDPAAKQAAATAAAAFARQARAAGAQSIALAATQACRVASDGAAFVGHLARELALDQAAVIDGRQEARLSRLGVRSRLDGPAQGLLLADVGGASTEVIDLADETDLGQSLALGAVSLTEACLRSDPPNAAQLADLARLAHQGLAPLAGRRARGLVASAGAAATIAAMAQGHTAYLPEEINNAVVTRAELARHFARLAVMPLAQRRAALGLDPKRADIILAGMAIFAALMDILKLDRMITMDAGLLEGILLDFAAIQSLEKPSHEA